MNFDECWNKHLNSEGDQVILDMIDKYGIKAVKCIAELAWKMSKYASQTGFLPDGSSSMKDCICEGNWRNIIHESESLLGKKFKHGGNIYVFCGVMYGDDDYYYCMWKENDMQLLSCVVSIEQHGFIEA